MKSKHTMSHILHLKKLTTGLPVAKTLIKYNSNSFEENEEEESFDIEHTKLKAGLEMMKMFLTLDDQVFKKKKIRKILLWLTSFKIIKEN